MIESESKQTIRALCSGVDPALVEDFFGGMDADYFSTFTAEEISTHIRMSAGLSSARPVQTRIATLPDGGLEITIAGFDYHSQFSILCGLLSAFSLDIRSGDIYSSSQKAARSALRRIVDVFQATVRPGSSFDEAKQREFQNELETLSRLLAAGGSEEARERLNRFLIERIENMREPLSGLFSPVELRFDSQISPEWTVLHARSEDAFALLYAISNGLSMRGVYIHKVRIRSFEQEVRDEFFILDRWGRKIEDAAEQERLRIAVAMIKRFTGFLPEAPDPARAMRHFDQLLDKIVESAGEDSADGTVAFLADGGGMHVLAQLLGSSDFLWNDLLRTRFSEFLPILEDLGARRWHPSTKASLRAALRALMETATDHEQKKRILNRFKDRQAFLIDCQHLLEPHGTLVEFSQALTDLAEVVIDETSRVCFERLIRLQSLPAETPCSFAVCGLGKFGGREMGYASDLELLFVHEGPAAFFDTLAHDVVDFIETQAKGFFHIDLRLRPYGDAGAWSASYERFTKYYNAQGEAEPFERQALIKLRWIAGEESLGRKVEEHRDAFTYGDTPWDMRNAVHLRHRQMQELVRPGQTNVKYSAGGIVDIEYAAQYLQLLNGRDHPDIRVPTTLLALNALRQLQIVRESDYETLHAAYLFLRRLIDALRIVRGDASDLVLPAETSEEFKSLARRLNYGEPDRATAAALLSSDIHEWMNKVHRYFAMRFETPKGVISDN